MAGPATLPAYAAKPLICKDLPERLWHCRIDVRICTSGTDPFLNARLS
ncbi:hypothetical protein [Methylobacterium sp. SI9]